MLMCINCKITINYIVLGRVFVVSYLLLFILITDHISIKTRKILEINIITHVIKANNSNSMQKLTFYKQDSD